jgi:hypothetical protein
MRADLLLETQPAAKSNASERKPRRFLIAASGAQTCSFLRAAFAGAELSAWSLISDVIAFNRFNLNQGNRLYATNLGS